MAYALKNRWSEAAPGAATELGDAVRAARLIGAEPDLVLFGGGNTSVKVIEDGRRVMYVKGSGADLAHVSERDFTPLALEPVRALLDQDLPDNRAMYAALAPHVLHRAAPRPSIETLMHAGMPAPHVIHTHAAAVLAIANTENAVDHLQAAFGPTAPVAPYRHSGLALARACGHTWRQADTQQARGLVLAHHGALVCGASAGEAYERMLELANRAERYLEDHGAPHGTAAAHESTQAGTDELMIFARLRHAAGRAAGRKLIATRRDGGFIGRFARRADVATLTSQGPSTPGHSIWTKRVPQIGRDVAAFAAAYRDYLDGAAELDCAPRIALDPGFGLAAFGVTKRYADIAAAVFVHDAAIMARAAALGGYATIEPHLMRAAELEYAGFEARVARDLPRAGEVHVVEQACERTAMIETLLAAGAAVVGLDANPAVECLINDAAFLGLASAVPGRIACTAIIHAFGGVDHIEAAPAWRQALSPFLSLNDA